MLMKNENFDRLVSFLKEMGEQAYFEPEKDPKYQDFIKDFPADKLREITLNDYCLGKRSQSFSWWIEVGLQDILGMYMPGTAKGHMIYWGKDGKLYKNNRLEHLSDEQALEYVLDVHATIAQANLDEDISWVDDKKRLAERMGREVLVMPGDARRLRLLACYNPTKIIPINSIKHLKHFLQALGYTQELPNQIKGVKLIGLLEAYFLEAKEQIPHLTRYGFMRGLYSDEVGIAPKNSVESDENNDDIEEKQTSAERHHMAPLNQILFGPPGTGKTYSTINKALEILDPDFLERLASSELSAAEQRRQSKLRFDEFAAQGRVRFTTFHQSFSYEDFVEGIRATVSEDSNAGAPRFVIEKGIFVELCESALSKRELDTHLGVREDAKVWKISIGEVNGETSTRNYCFQHNEMRVGWPNAGDLTTGNFRQHPHLTTPNKNVLSAFSSEAQEGDIVLCFASNKSISAVGVISGDYFYQESPHSQVRSDFVHVRPVKWLLKDIDFSVFELNGNKLLTLQTMYCLSRISWPRLREALEQKGFSLGDKENEKKSEPYVLIIDEINRGNVSRIFGELITLLEPSKRSGAKEALSVILPYSKQVFSVPDNVYVIGTMNTADRSLSGLDIALRRRFVFEELLPNLEVLQGIVVKKEEIIVEIDKMLEVINQRIEVLLGRDYQIGHAYFLPLRGHPTLHCLSSIFLKQIIPLLQEYFFDDWQRIALVLNDHNKKENLRFIKSVANPSIEKLFGKGIDLPVVESNRWEINDYAFTQLESYSSIIEVLEVTGESQLWA